MIQLQDISQEKETPLSPNNAASTTESSNKGQDESKSKSKCIITLVVVCGVIITVALVATFTISVVAITATSHFRMPEVTSCADLPPSSPSGYYWVSNSIGSAVPVYCDMTRSCGGVTGGWMRVAKLDMTDSVPTDSSNRIIATYTYMREEFKFFRLLLSNITVTFTILECACGRIIAYQFGATNATIKGANNISSAYVDGVSLTHGNPRQHIWTFAAALDESGNS